MPSSLTYPGVYVEELPSGVHAITGVSTSVTAFIGAAKLGPINKAVHLYSFADFERRLGGLHGDSQMSYAVRQFFLNGGSEALAVRLAKDPKAATITLKDSSGAKDVLVVTASDEGAAGNGIDLIITQGTNTFNLVARYLPENDPSLAKLVEYTGLSMNKNDIRFVEDIVNADNGLIRVALPAGLTIPGSSKGTSRSAPLLDSSGNLVDISTGLLDAIHCQFRIAVNGLDPVSVKLDPGADVGAAGDSEKQRIEAMCSKIRLKIKAQAAGRAEYDDIACTFDDTSSTILVTSGVGGLQSTVRILQGEANDVTSRLNLGSAFGGVELDAAREARPGIVPLSGRLESDPVDGNDANLVNASHNSIRLTIDDGMPVNVAIDHNQISGGNGPEKLSSIASLIQSAVRSKRPKENLAFSGFKCIYDGTAKTLVLSSGTVGKGSSVRVENAPENSMSTELALTQAEGAEQTNGEPFYLTGGAETPFGPDDAEALYNGSRADRTGIYALEGVDIFNLLCLPGVSSRGILATAMSYCQERRAFFIMDPPENLKGPEEISAYVSGADVPKSDYGAIYYPWLKIADPLKSGKLLAVPPSGSIAGLMARTDSQRGVWKAPAGTEATIAGTQAVAYLLTDKENGSLNPHGINCIRIFPVFGAIAWGARTLRGDDQMASEWKYIPVRRLALFMEESLYRGTKWAVFESNDEPLWAQLRLNIGSFMHDLFRRGAFAGQTPRDAYFVKCDRETTTQSDVNLGVVNILIGFAPLKPAEFVVLKFQQMAGQIAT